MLRSLWFIALCASLAACNGEREGGGGSGASIEAQAGEETSAQARLAYAHSVRMEADEAQVEALLNAGRQACLAIAQSQQCVILQMRLESGREAQAGLKIRATAQGVQQVLERLKSQGRLLSQTTHAQDLAAPLQDAAKQLAMLKDYRSKLEALSGRAAGDIDALIKVSHELAQVQSDLEAAASQQAQLQQRVETQTLELAIESRQHRGFARPIQQALGDFAGNLSSGLAGFVTALAYLLPWLMAAGGVAWALLRWRRKRQQK
ncbi:hypothetical protein HNP55_004224 [Paucibacter oligotrophus]|uniref:DUF4349 domain-containing protein n=1 Tax=Roseateles oligotrophus TaxID=1769250 RepID=A0A840LGC1_9BURK|nr:DUF4349 domain-containing protein [Roseateles oligotrophus]MBB4845672.1 hypothetical protein [Roseateles oligotrophus]